MRLAHPQFADTFLAYYHNVPDELVSGFWNYFAYGIEPGSFGMAVLCNDFVNASCRAHPSLSVATFRDMAKWLINHAPPGSWGNEDNVIAWCRKTDQERLDIMIEYKLRPGEFDILAGRAVT
jgi:hypothetical protein